MVRNISIVISLLVSMAVHAQNKTNNLIYVDKEGVMRYTVDNKEAAFFGVNYTVPFAHGYKMHKRLGIDLKKAIDADVYHMHRLGLNAFRVHVWDTEISDSAGNLLQNEHLDLYDYLLWRLESNGIKTVLTPLAYWGNGYPEPDEKTGSFASIINNKQKVLTEEWAIKAQENYLRQLLQHVNPYTKKKYGDDRDIIALEINNEPHHTGTKEKVAEYISRMVKAVRSTGWSKPVFYNISESPAYADAVANSDIEGVSFQWYPTGLVANHSLKGNYLPNVDHYRIPFGDTIASFKSKAKMVYEFDAADVAGSYMYPAMARSFRTAGFQWATQFAYDPVHTAHFNTEYQTHYLNLLYTPSKAISLLIASKAFQKLPRGKDYSVHPADTLFDVFRVSYQQNLSEMNEDTAFFYSNSTTTQPKNISKLKHIAGVGSSPVVQYSGTGAYFLDKISDGHWLLEIFPDVVGVNDPFGRASPNRVATVLNADNQTFKIALPDLGDSISAHPELSPGTHHATAVYYFNRANSNVATVALRPGIYHLFKGAGVKPKYQTRPALQSGYDTVLRLYHVTMKEVAGNADLKVMAAITAADTTDWVNLEVRNSMNQWKTISGKVINSKFEATVPAEMMKPGIVNYRMILRRKNGDVYVFPGGHKGDPYAWDNQYLNESWSVTVTHPDAPIALFDPLRDRDQLMIYNPDWRNNLVGYTTIAFADDPSQVVRASQVLKLSARSPEQLLAWQLYVGDMIQTRYAKGFDNLVIHGRSKNEDQTVVISLIDANGTAMSKEITFQSETNTNVLRPMDFTRGRSLLLPAAYPRFMPKWFETKQPLFDFSKIEKIEIRLEGNGSNDKEIEIDIIQLLKY